MIASRNMIRALAVFLAGAVLTGCGESKNPGYQGWVEADMIFVSPDEQGRVVKLNIREGDKVEVGMPLYAVDDDLQQAALNQSNATLANAQQAYDRAASLSKTGSGTQARQEPRFRAAPICVQDLHMPQRCEEGCVQRVRCSSAGQHSPATPEAGGGRAAHWPPRAGLPILAS